MEPRARLSSSSGFNNPGVFRRCFRSSFFLGGAFQPLPFPPPPPPRCLLCGDVVVVFPTLPSSLWSPSSSSSSVSELLDSSESPSPADDPVFPLLDFLRSSSLQLIRGSYTNASNTAITLSLLARSTRITASDVNLNIPSMPHTSIAFTNMRVNRKGIFSGNFSRCIATSKQSPKSMCTILPDRRLIIRLQGCLSPNPRI
mmetsp:Transcript_46151/g.74233  ORF Transcript_46151/g.74233 Transcript_46151/m.74233 type:complete len:200 (+) Transcript_46151:491-1090(+)